MHSGHGCKSEWGTLPWELQGAGEHAILLVTALPIGSGREPGSQGRDVKVPFAKTRSPGALPGLDHAQQQQLVALSRVRRAMAAAATARKQLELQLDEMERGETPPSDIDLLRRRYTAARDKEKRLFAASRDVQVRIDEFRLAKEAAESAYLAAGDALHAAQAEIGGSA